MKKKVKAIKRHKRSGKKWGRPFGIHHSNQTEAVKLEMMKLRAEGKSINEIAHEMKKDWTTVAKVVKQEEKGRLDKYLDEMEDKAAEMLPQALKTLNNSIKQGKHSAHLSYGLVRDFVLRRRPLIQQQNNFVPVQVDMETADAQGVKQIIQAFTEIAMETHRIFNIPMPELEEARVRADRRAAIGNDKKKVEPKDTVAM